MPHTPHAPESVPNPAPLSSPEPSAATRHEPTSEPEADDSDSLEGDAELAEWCEPSESTLTGEILVDAIEPAEPNAAERKAFDGIARAFERVLVRLRGVFEVACVFALFGIIAAWNAAVDVVFWCLRVGVSVPVHVAAVGIGSVITIALLVFAACRSLRA